MISRVSFPDPQLPRRSISLPPRFLFWIFFGSNLLLSYFSLSPVPKLWIAVLGLLTPFSLACWTLRKTSATSEPDGFQFLRDEFLPESWLKLGVAFISLSLFLRFWHLTTLSVWPLEDEGGFSLFTQRALEGGPFLWFYNYGAVLPLLLCGLGIFYKLFGISLQILWLYPAFLSSLALFFYGWATRRLFSRSFSFLFMLSLGLSYWPLFIGRILTVGNLFVLWEGVSLAAFAFFATQKAGISRIWGAMVVGLAVGTGFYISLLWAIVTFCLVVTMTLVCFKKNPKETSSYTAFLGTTGLISLPIAWHLAHSMNTGFIKGLWSFNGRSYVFIFQDFSTYVSVLFWGKTPSYYFCFNPYWGGFLNPLLTSLVFLGFLELWRYKANHWTRYFVLFSLVLWIPQILTRGEEYMRVVQIIPLLLFLIALGFHSFFRDLSMRKLMAGALALAFVFISTGLDCYHLFGAYHQWWDPSNVAAYNTKSLERLRAFQLFDQTQRRWGPGLILCDLMDNVNDQTLELATWKFNALANPSALIPRIPWVGLVCNVHYRNYLSHLLPHAQWTWLASDVFRENGGLMAGIIPVEAGQLPILRRWVAAQKAMHIFSWDVLENAMPLARSLSPQLEQLYPLFKGDRFLESCYWEKQAQCAFMAKQYPEMIKPLQKALLLGIPEAHLYNRLGVVCLATGDFRTAQWALGRALQFKDNQTSAAFLYTHYLEPHRPLYFP